MLKPAINPSFAKTYRREILLITIALVSLAAAFSLPITAGQDLNYHNFADRREFFGIPNFPDVASNLAFLAAGIAGLRICFKKDLGKLRNAWIMLFAGVALVSAGSAYYHASPMDQTLVWDRLPMTIGFMGLLVAILGEHISPRLNRLLVPALLAGFFSVIYWQLFGDLRIYIWVQAMSLLIIPVVMILYRGSYTHGWLLLIGILFYGLAKITESNDRKIFELSGGKFVSGHTLKHLLAAAGCLMIAVMLEKRKLSVR